MARQVYRNRGEGTYGLRQYETAPLLTQNASVDVHEFKEARLMDLHGRMLEVYQRVNDCFSSAFALNHCESLTFDVVEYRSRSYYLLSHLPCFEEMQGMNQVAGLWSDLFQTELSMLSNPLLLDKNIAIAKRMKHHYLTRDHPPPSASQRLQASPALTEVQASALDYTPVTDDSSVEPAVMSVLNNLVTFNERLSKDCSEDRTYYDKLREGLIFIRESELLRRSPIGARDRGKALPFLKRLCQSFDTDKCTLNLSMLFLDFYLETVVAREDFHDTEDDSRVLRIAAAAYLLACALREHWTDISSDSYLERASQMVNGVFTPQDIMATQLDILQTMPRGFTSMYTTMEYGIFFLANIKGNYKPPRTHTSTPSNPSKSSGQSNPTMRRGSSSEDTSAYIRDYRLRRALNSPNDSDATMPSGSSTESTNGFPRPSTSRFGSSYDTNRTTNAPFRQPTDRLSTLPVNETEPSASSAPQGMARSLALRDYLLLEMAFRYMVENGGFAFLYHCLIKWDDMYIARNWNLFIPPSRMAAVLIFHFFAEFCGVDWQKDVVWCRRFCFRVLRMLYDCDVALWYQMFQESIRKWTNSVAQSSTRLGEMALLLELSGQKFRAAEATLHTFWSKLLFDYTERGGELTDLEHVSLKSALPAVYQLMTHK
ncbi:amine-terminal domain cyclin, putative [Babesia ovata]|uniref:Amine-terminal domain cyclin, putative n=1 Tax=Babesia ovata TaxID=189622 RepID=A0A2H6K920_9APIC|nr:amine-terminal domain cyclin, putative [Babesia ovata]GBE59495.1 amine-terminal domain cyclin, putative [Babesia ovata]